jgi:hypothetical protein
MRLLNARWQPPTDQGITNMNQTRNESAFRGATDGAPAEGAVSMREMPAPHMGSPTQLARFGRFGDDRPHQGGDPPPGWGILLGKLADRDDPNHTPPRQSPSQPGAEPRYGQTQMRPLRRFS